MNGKSRGKLFFGFFIVLILMVGLVVYVDNTRSYARADEAFLEAKSYTAGIDYSGVISDQFVEVGDSVTAGTPLFHVESNVLQERIRELSLDAESLTYPITDEGEIIIEASKDGYVSEIKYGQGSFVPANEEIAEILSSEEVYVSATLRVPKRDLNRIYKGAPMRVDLPNGKSVTTSVISTAVVDQDGVITVEVTARLDETELDPGLILSSASGSPVQASIKLVDSTLFDKALTVWNNLFGRVA